jgi:hypothetical protein
VLFKVVRIVAEVFVYTALLILVIGFWLLYEVVTFFYAQDEKRNDPGGPYYSGM